MRVRGLALAAALALACMAAAAADGWVRIEQRLTPAQMH
jgi:hypothetical protein